jgi:glutamyl/glutaminyl-tRNA synthetase
MNTRFNPTCNGCLHLGHLYTILVNEWLASRSGGSFIVRFDDTSSTVRKLSHSRVENIIKGQKRDIRNFGIKVDDWQYQSVRIPNVEIYLKEKDIPIPEMKSEFTEPIFVRMMRTSWIPFPYDPRETLERVVLDHQSEITHLIRGEEFSTEYSLYMEYCRQLRFTPPEFIYLPRLTCKYGDISKTNGGYSLAELTGNGYTPEELIDMLAHACLVFPKNGWDIYNLKDCPYINL